MIVSERKYLKVCTQVDSSVPVESADIFSDGTSFTIFFPAGGVLFIILQQYSWSVFIGFCCILGNSMKPLYFFPEYSSIQAFDSLAP